MHKVVSVTILKPMIYNAKRNLEIVKTLNTKKKEEYKPSFFKELKSMINYDYTFDIEDEKILFYEKVLNNIELLCKVNGDIILDCKEYEALDYLFNFKYSD